VSKNDEDTCSLTLRTIWQRTSDVLYEYSRHTREPICQLMNGIVSFYFQHHREILKAREDDIRRLVEEYGAKDGTS